MDAKQIPKMQSIERNTDGRPLNLPGIYRCKETGQEIITSSDVNTGVAQADAIITIGDRLKQTWEWVADVPTATELLAMRRAQEVKDATDEAIQRGQEEAELKAAKKAALELAKQKLVAA